jgi:hypothetical protein
MDDKEFDAKLEALGKASEDPLRVLSKDHDRREAKRDAFIDALATYLTRDLAVRSMELEMGKKTSIEWAKLFQLSGLQGYPKHEDAVKALKELL